MKVLLWCLTAGVGFAAATTPPMRFTNSIPDRWGFLRDQLTSQPEHFWYDKNNKPYCYLDGEVGECNLLSTKAKQLETGVRAEYIPMECLECVDCKKIMGEIQTARRRYWSPTKSCQKLNEREEGMTAEISRDEAERNNVRERSVAPQQFHKNSNGDMVDQTGAPKAFATFDSGENKGKQMCFYITKFGLCDELQDKASREHKTMRFVADHCEKQGTDKCLDAMIKLAKDEHDDLDDRTDDGTLTDAQWALRYSQWGGAQHLAHDDQGNELCTLRDQIGPCSYLRCLPASFTYEVNNLPAECHHLGDKCPKVRGIYDKLVGYDEKIVFKRYIVDKNNGTIVFDGVAVAVTVDTETAIPLHVGKNEQGKPMCYLQHGIDTCDKLGAKDDKEGKVAMPIRKEVWVLKKEKIIQFMEDYVNGQVGGDNQMTSAAAYKLRRRSPAGVWQEPDNSQRRDLEARDFETGRGCFNKAGEPVRCTVEPSATAGQPAKYEEHGPVGKRSANVTPSIAAEIPTKLITKTVTHVTSVQKRTTSSADAMATSKRQDSNEETDGVHLHTEQSQKGKEIQGRDEGKDRAILPIFCVAANSHGWAFTSGTDGTTFRTMTLNSVANPETELATILVATVSNNTLWIAKGSDDKVSASLSSPDANLLCVNGGDVDGGDGHAAATGDRQGNHCLGDLAHKQPLFEMSAKAEAWGFFEDKADIKVVAALPPVPHSNKRDHEVAGREDLPTTPTTSESHAIPSSSPTVTKGPLPTDVGPRGLGDMLKKIFDPSTLLEVTVSRSTFIVTERAGDSTVGVSTTTDAEVIPRQTIEASATELKPAGTSSVSTATPTYSVIMAPRSVAAEPTATPIAARGLDEFKEAVEAKMEGQKGFWSGLWNYCFGGKPTLGSCAVESIAATATEKTTVTYTQLTHKTHNEGTGMLNVPTQWTINIVGDTTMGEHCVTEGVYEAAEEFKTRATKTTVITPASTPASTTITDIETVTATTTTGASRLAIKGREIALGRATPVTLAGPDGRSTIVQRYSEREAPIDSETTTIPVASNVIPQTGVSFGRLSNAVTGSTLAASPTHSARGTSQKNWIGERQTDCKCDNSGYYQDFIDMKGYGVVDGFDYTAATHCVSCDRKVCTVEAAQACLEEIEGPQGSGDMSHERRGAPSGPKATTSSSAPGSTSVSTRLPSSSPSPKPTDQKILKAPRPDNVDMNGVPCSKAMATCDCKKKDVDEYIKQQQYTKFGSVDDPSTWYANCIWCDCICMIDDAKDFLRINNLD